MAKKRNIKEFIKSTWVYGCFALLPLVVLLLILKVIYEVLGFFTGATIELFGLANYYHSHFIATVMLLLFMIILSWLVGIFLQTELGKIIFHVIEQQIFKKLPGYRQLQQGIKQFGKEEKTLDSSTKMVFVDLFGNGTLCTGFLVGENTIYKTVYVPSALHPFQGSFYVVRSSQVEIVENAKLEDGFKTVLSCGVGIDPFLKASELKEIDKEVKSES